jgi:hypothetical protein
MARRKAELVQWPDPCDDSRVAMAGAGTPDDILHRPVKQRDEKAGGRHVQDDDRAGATLHDEQASHQHVPDHAVAKAAGELEHSQDRTAAAPTVQGQRQPEVTSVRRPG